MNLQVISSGAWKWRRLTYFKFFYDFKPYFEKLSKRLRKVRKTHSKEEMPKSGPLYPQDQHLLYPTNCWIFSPNINHTGLWRSDPNETIEKKWVLRKQVHNINMGKQILEMLWNIHFQSLELMVRIRKVLQLLQWNFKVQGRSWKSASKLTFETFKFERNYTRKTKKGHTKWVFFGR